MTTFIEDYLDDFFMEQENNSLRKLTTNKKSGVIKIDNKIYAIPYKATGKVENKYEVGFGHVINDDDILNNYLTAVTSNGEIYMIPFDNPQEIKLTKKQAKDIARHDASFVINRVKSKITELGGNFDNLNKGAKQLAVDYELNVGEDDKNRSGVAAFPKFFKALINDNHTIAFDEYKRYMGSKKNPLKNRNIATNNLLLDIFNLENPPTQAQIDEQEEIEVVIKDDPKEKKLSEFEKAFSDARAQGKDIFTFKGKPYTTAYKEEVIEDMPTRFASAEIPPTSAKKGGMVERNYHDYAPRNI